MGAGKKGKKVYTPDAQCYMFINGFDEVGWSFASKKKPGESTLKNVEAGSWLHGMLVVRTKHMPPNPALLAKFELKGKKDQVFEKVVQDEEGNQRIESWVDDVKFMQEKTKMALNPMGVPPHPDEDGRFSFHYPMAYYIRPDLCDSFDRRGHKVVYSLKVKAKFVDKSAKVKSSKRKIDIMGRRPTLDELTKKPKVDKGKHRAFVGGDIKVTASLDAACFMEGQSAVFSAHIENDSDKLIQLAEVEFQEKFKYTVIREEGGVYKRSNRHDMCEQKFRALEIQPKSKRDFVFTVALPPIVEPPTTELHHSGPYGLKVKHYAKLRLDVPWGLDCRVYIPIRIAPNPTRYLRSEPFQYAPIPVADIALPPQYQHPIPQAVAMPQWNFAGPAMMEVVLLKAKDLPKMDMSLMGGKADPYVTIILNDRHVRTSRIMHNNRNPTFDQSFIFLLSRETEVSNEMSIFFNCYDYDNSSKDDKIGSATVKYQPSMEPLDLEMVLLKEKKGETKERGKLYARVRMLS